MSLSEIHQLTRLARESPRDPTRTNALNKAATVALCSAIEGYIEGVFDEGWDFLHATGIAVERLPDELRARIFLDRVEGILESRRRFAKLNSRIRKFFEREGHLWQAGTPFDALKSGVEEFSGQFQNSLPKGIVRLFRLYGISDIFIEIQRETGHSLRADTLVPTMKELVEKRNGIAHGDATVIPTALDVTRYFNAGRVTCRHIDVAAGIQLEELTGQFPWHGPFIASQVEAVVRFPDWL